MEAADRNSGGIFHDRAGHVGAVTEALINRGDLCFDPGQMLSHQAAGFRGGLSLHFFRELHRLLRVKVGQIHHAFAP
jgi:hypothetical protein